MSASAFGVEHPEPISKSAQGFGGRAASRFMFGPEKAWAKEGMLRPKVYMTNKKLQAANQLKLVEDSHGAPYRRALASGDMFKSKSTSFDPKRFIRGPESNGPKKAGDSVKGVQLNIAGTQARKNARARGEF